MAQNHIKQAGILSKLPGILASIKGRVPTGAQVQAGIKAAPVFGKGVAVGARNQLAEILAKLIGASPKVKVTTPDGLARGPFAALRMVKQMGGGLSYAQPLGAAAVNTGIAAGAGAGVGSLIKDSAYLDGFYDACTRRGVTPAMMDKLAQMAGGVPPYQPGEAPYITQARIRQGVAANRDKMNPPQQDPGVMRGGLKNIANVTGFGSLGGAARTMALGPINPWNMGAVGDQLNDVVQRSALDQGVAPDAAATERMTGGKILHNLGGIIGNAWHKPGWGGTQTDYEIWKAQRANKEQDIHRTEQARLANTRKSGQPPVPASSALTYNPTPWGRDQYRITDYTDPSVGYKPYTPSVNTVPAQVSNPVPPVSQQSTAGITPPVPPQLPTPPKPPVPPKIV